MNKYIIFTILIVTGTNFVSVAQQPKYTPKHFVASEDSTEFKSIRPPKNGLARVFLELEAPEIWDTDDNNVTIIRGYAPALVWIEGNYKDGKKNDLFKAYLIDSLDHSKKYKIWEQTYVNDKLNGEWRTYFLNGTLVKVANFKDDSLHGISREYWIDGKRIQNEKEYITGTRYYIQRTYFNSGKLEREIPIKSYQINGLARSWYEDGTIQEEVNFANDQFHGTRKYYYPNGKVWSVHEYKNGKPWNAIGNYTNKGVSRPPGTLKNGNGTMLLYDEDGSVRETLNYVNGIQQ